MIAGDVTVTVDGRLDAGLVMSIQLTGWAGTFAALMSRRDWLCMYLRDGVMVAVMVKNLPITAARKSCMIDSGTSATTGIYAGSMTGFLSSDSGGGAARRKGRLPRHQMALFYVPGWISARDHWPVAEKTPSG